MLNDYGRNEFYRRALARVVPACGPDCVVLDVGAGSGLLSMMAAGLGAASVVAIEANPSLAALAEETVARNRPTNFPSSNVTVIPALSSAVAVGALPGGRQADVLVTETFGTLLLGEGAINFVPDARDRLLKPSGVVIPAGGCQYATLVEAPDFARTLHPGSWGGIELGGLDALQDTVYWKATVGASRMPLKRLSDRVCVLEVDWRRDTRQSVPLNRTFRVSASAAGSVHAVLFDWDVWADDSRSDILSTAPGSRNFAGDVAWGWLLQIQEEAREDWQFSPARPVPLAVEAGDRLDVAVEFIAGGISMHVRARRAAGPEGELGPLPTSVFSPARMRGADRADMVEANELYLPIAGDTERHSFYDAALREAIAAARAKTPKPTLLDCSSGAGLPALAAAKQHGLQSVVLTRRKAFSQALRQIAKDNGVEELVEAYTADPRDMLDVLLPNGEPADIVVLEPPGTPLHGLSPFAVLPAIRRRLLKDGGIVVPGGACFEVGLVESGDLASMFSVPGGRWEEIDLTVWNEEAVRHGVLERLVPYTKWLGPQSTMRWRWLSEPRCVHEVDFGTYGQAELPNETTFDINLLTTAAGRAHALVGHWVVWESMENRRPLGPESGYPGRALTWPRFVQALAAFGPPGNVEPIKVEAGQSLRMRVRVLQGVAKRTAAAGPEIALHIEGSAWSAAAKGAAAPEVGPRDIGHASGEL